MTDPSSSDAQGGPDSAQPQRVEDTPRASWWAKLFQRVRDELRVPTTRVALIVAVVASALHGLTVRVAEAWPPHSVFALALCAALVAVQHKIKKISENRWLNLWWASLIGIAFGLAICAFLPDASLVTSLNALAAAMVIASLAMLRGVDGLAENAGLCRWRDLLLGRAIPLVLIAWIALVAMRVNQLVGDREMGPLSITWSKDKLQVLNVDRFGAVGGFSLLVLLLLYLWLRRLTHDALDVPIAPEQRTFDLEKGGPDEVGLALSGGGTRAMTVALGVLSALSQAQVWARVRWISSVSGGSWASAAAFATASEQQGEASPLIERTIDRVRRQRSRFMGRRQAHGMLALAARSLLSATAQFVGVAVIAFALVLCGLCATRMVDERDCLRSRYWSVRAGHEAELQREIRCPNKPKPSPGVGATVLGVLNRGPFHREVSEPRPVERDAEYIPSSIVLKVWRYSRDAFAQPTSAGAARFPVFVRVRIGVAVLWLVAFLYGLYSLWRAWSAQHSYKRVAAVLRAFSAVAVVTLVTLAFNNGAAFLLSTCLLLGAAIAFAAWRIAPAVVPKLMFGALSSAGALLTQWSTVTSVVREINSQWEFRLSHIIEGINDFALWVPFGERWEYSQQTKLLAEIAVLAAIYGALSFVPLSWLTLHAMWRRRLVEMLFADRPDKVAAGNGESEASKSEVQGLSIASMASRAIWPKVIFNASVSIPTAAKEQAEHGTVAAAETCRVVVRSGGTDHFEVSADSVGGPSVGQTPYAHVQQDFTLDRTIAISSAAVNTSGGSLIPSFARPALRVLAVRLGTWVLHPKTRNDYDRAPKPLPQIQYLVREWLELGRPTDRMLLLADGGHFDNLGWYALVRRRVRTILSVDASADPEWDLGDIARTLLLLDAEGWKVDDKLTSLDGLRPPKEGDSIARRTAKNPVAKIVLRRQDKDGSVSNDDAITIFLVKSSLLNDNTPTVARLYALRSERFPQETTADQSYHDEQFEAYLALGRAMGHTLIEALEKESRPDRSIPS